MLQHLGGFGAPEDLVLAQREEPFENVLGKGEADDQLLPREEGTVEESSKALWW